MKIFKNKTRYCYINYVLYYSVEVKIDIKVVSWSIFKNNYLSRKHWITAIQRHLVVKVHTEER